MLRNIWDMLLYEPLANALAFLVNIIPGGDVGLAVIILTILVKILLFPLTQGAIEGQAKMARMGPELSAIKKSGKSKEEQAKLTFEIYKKHKANPFAGCLSILIQIPILLALYFVFLKGLDFSQETLYSFVSVPDQINTMFLGLVDITKKSLPLAILAGISQYAQAHIMPKPQSQGDAFADSFSKSMHIQMKYFFPLLITVFSYSLAGAVAVYWITSNIFSTFQQIYAKKKKSIEIPS